MSKRHKILCIMGRTGSGKSSLADKLCERCGVSQVISYTTRPQRNTQDTGHIFVDDDIYNQMKSNNQIAAYTEIAGYKYWSTIDQLYKNTIYVIDPIGVKSLQALNLSDLDIITVYINVPDPIREDRAINKRGDDKTKFRVRDFSERKQFQDMLKNGEFDYSIQNVHFAEAYSVLRWIAIIEGAIDIKGVNQNAQDSN